MRQRNVIPVLKRRNMAQENLGVCRRLTHKAEEALRAGLQPPGPRVTWDKAAGPAHGPAS